MHYHFKLGTALDEPDEEGIRDTYDEAFEALVELTDLTVEDIEWYVLYDNGIVPLEGNRNAEIAECDCVCNPDDL